MKSKIHSAVIAALALGASAVSLLAQEAGPNPQGPPNGPPPHHGPPPSELFKALDTNHDGVISADEIANAPAALKALAGASGQITRDSLRPKPPEDDRSNGGTPTDQRGPGGGPAGHHHGPPPQNDAQNQPQDQSASSSSGSPGPNGRHHGPPPGGPLFDALDTNHDGVLSADEIANASKALKTLDKNGDGQLTREEMRPSGPPRHGPED